MISDSEIKLIYYNIGVVENVIADSKIPVPSKWKEYIASYRKFIETVGKAKDFYTLYNYLYMTSALPLWELLTVIDGLSAYLRKGPVVKNVDYVTEAYYIMRYNALLDDLMSASWILLSCSRNGLLKLLQNAQYKIEMLGLRPVLYLSAYIVNVIQRCQVIKDICPHRVLGYNSQ